MINGILWKLWKLRTGAPRRDLPARYGPWRGLATRFEKRAANYRALVVIAALMVWLAA